MKKKTKLIIYLGVVCAVLSVISVWYTITFNNSRFIVPMSLSEYIFRMKDLPMIMSGIFFALYILYLGVWLLTIIIKNKYKLNNKPRTEMSKTRKLNPKLGLLGILGFLGFIGFISYPLTGDIFPFVFFVFFGFFGLYYEGKMSETLMDERFRENYNRAQLNASKVSIAIIYISIIIFSQGKLFGNIEYSYIALLIVSSLAIALLFFLSQYLTYRYDYCDESEE